MTPPKASVAVILVAGVGERLRPLTNDRPKALVEVAGEAILVRAVRLLVNHGVREIVLATGYREHAIREAMGGSPVPVHICPNPRYDCTQNSVSLAGCEQAVGGRAFYKLDGDLVFDAAILSRLDGVDAPLVVAVDRGVALGAEEMKVRMGEGGRILAFGKGLEPRLAQGESIGVERVSDVAVSLLFHGLRRAIGAGRTNLYYEDVYSELIEGGLEARGVDVAGLSWAEVDTMEDLERARALMAG